MNFAEEASWTMWMSWMASAGHDALQFGAAGSVMNLGFGLAWGFGHWASTRNGSASGHFNPTLGFTDKMAGVCKSTSCATTFLAQVFGFWMAGFLGGHLGVGSLAAQSVPEFSVTSFMNEFVGSAVLVWMWLLLSCEDKFSSNWGGRSMGFAIAMFSAGLFYGGTSLHNPSFLIGSGSMSWRFWQWGMDQAAFFFAPFAAAFFVSLVHAWYRK